jgi:hypothetical protein
MGLIFVNYTTIGKFLKKRVRYSIIAACDYVPEEEVKIPCVYRWQDAITTARKSPVIIVKPLPGIRTKCDFKIWLDTDEGNDEFRLGSDEYFRFIRTMYKQCASETMKRNSFEEKP